MQDWAAWGVFWGDSWGSSWGPLHEVEETTGGGSSSRKPPRSRPFRPSIPVLLLPRGWRDRDVDLMLCDLL